MRTYLTYVHAKPDTESASGIFYVGKGSHKRAHLINRVISNRHYTNTVKKYGAENILVGTIECSSEAIAFDLERGLIKCLRRSGVKLTNLTDGGEGTSGYKLSEDQTARISVASKRNWADPAYRARIVKAQTEAQRNVVMTEKKTVSALVNAAKGREALKRPDTKAIASKKNSEHSLLMWADEDHRNTVIEKMKSVWTEEKRRIKGQDVLGRVRMTNGESERNVKPEGVADLLRLGWTKGRKIRTPNKRPRSDKKPF